MKTIFVSLSLFLSAAVIAQDNNLAINGNFEKTSGKVHSLGAFTVADSISSSNNTTVDLFSKDACGRDYKIPVNYMGSQTTTSGNNYAGITAFYGDQTGWFFTRPGYQRYSEYIQLPLSQPLTAGAVYKVNFNAALAEKSAYAVSGLGVYFSNVKLDIQNNSFLSVTPNIVATDVMADTNWVNFSGTYVASGGERYLTLGAFSEYMDTVKVIPPAVNNTRKAYYYIDDITVSPGTKEGMDELYGILYGTCYPLKNLNFETDQAAILPASYGELNRLAHFLGTYPYVNVYIDGFTDKTGTEQHNEKLSKDRAAAIRDYLVSKGIKAKRLTARGYGESQPIDAKNNSSAVNRRVEVTVCAIR